MDRHQIIENNRQPLYSGGVDRYRADWTDGKFVHVRSLGPVVNSGHGEYHAAAFPDERYIVRRPVPTPKALPLIPSA